MLSCLLLPVQIAHDAAMAYMNSKEPQYRTIADVIIMALAKSKTINHGKGNKLYIYVYYITNNSCDNIVYPTE